MRDPTEIERGIATIARSPNGGIVVTGSPFASKYRELIITLAASHKLPAIYWERFFTTVGDYCLMGRIPLTSIGRQPVTSIVSSKARNRLTCLYRRQTNTNW
jgi:hypothetical protein